MFHFTIFGGSEVTINGGGQLILTLCGGTDIRRPTLAKQIMQEKHRLMTEQTVRPQGDEPSDVQGMLHFFDRRALGSHRPRRRSTFVLTICGGVEIKPPSIAEEFMEMRELVASGLITEEEWDQLIGRLYQFGELEVSSFTLMGGMEEVSLSEAEELRKIQGANELGLISEDEQTALRSVVGRDPRHIRMLLRQTAFS